MAFLLVFNRLSGAPWEILFVLLLIFLYFEGSAVDEYGANAGVSGLSNPVDYGI